MIRRARVGAVLSLLLAALPASAWAHPLGNFSVNHYAGLRVSPESIEIDLVIDVAEIPAIEAIAALDADGDGKAGATELNAARGPACRSLAEQLRLTVDGRALVPAVVSAGMQTAPGAGGLPTLRTVCRLAAPLAAPIDAGAELTFADASYPERIGWREIVIRGDGVTVEGDGAEDDVSLRLTSYPTDLLRQPLNERMLSVSVLPGGPRLAAWSPPDAWPLDAGAAGSPGASALVPGGVTGELAGLADFRNLSLPVAMLGLVLAAAAGAGHALSPGHGKTVMAAYLVAARGGSRHAVLLGAAVTVSHTLGVLLLAVVVLVAGRVLPPERLYPILTVLSGATVALIGIVLLAGCIRRALLARSHARQQHHGHPHHHPHEHAHSGTDPRLPGWRGLAALGIAGGLVPSTSALILLLAAVGAGQPGYGLALSIAFGFGMAAVLTGMGLALVHGRTLMSRAGGGLPGARLAGSAIPWLAAVGVLAGGVALTGQAVASSL